MDTLIITMALATIVIEDPGGAAWLEEISPGSPTRKPGKPASRIEGVDTSQRRVGATFRATYSGRLRRPAPQQLSSGTP